MSEDSEEQKEIVDMKCRGQANCDGTEAAVMEIDDSQRRYTCQTCGKSWMIQSPKSLNM